MNLYKQIHSRILESLATLAKEQGWDVINTEKIEAVPPKEAGHGDIATNAAMVLAPQLKAKPRALAELIAPKLEALAEVERIEIAGPGFINLTLKSAFWQSIVPVILKEKAGYGNSEIGTGKKVNVEYVSVNPTGPMHVGHGRYVYGDALALLLLKAGFRVTKEYYINDAGAQVEKVAETAYLRYREANGKEIGEIPEGLYPGDYMVAIGEALAKEYGRELMNAEKEEWLPKVKPFAIESIMTIIKEDLALLGIEHDVFTSEQSIRDKGLVDKALKKLEEKGLIYTGVLEPPKGKKPDDWEPAPQLLFKSTEFGDDLDRALKKSDGSWTYFAPDVAYHWDKVNRGFDKLIDIFGIDHGGYVARLKAAVAALSDKKVELDVKLCALVKFIRGGEPLKMSKRAGTFITVREVVEEVGKDVFRFIMLTRRPDQPLDFDLEKVIEMSKDNPVFYVQYAHARAKSVIRNANEAYPHIGKEAEQISVEELAQLATKAELELLKIMASFPRIVEAAALAGEPHRIAYFLQELAATFHGLWNLGNNDEEVRFIVSGNESLTKTRVALAMALAHVIASGLLVLGVEPVEEMR